MTKDQEKHLPKNWLWIRVLDIGQIVTGTTPSKSKKIYYNGDVPLFKPTDLNKGYYVKSATDTLTAEGLKKSRYVPEGSTLVTCIGATIGKTGFSRVNGTCNQQINAIIPREGISPNYVYFACISPDFQKDIVENSSSTTLPILNKGKFQLLSFPLAPLAEQHRIVDKIEELFSDLDDGIKSLKTAQQQLKVYRQAVLKWAFEGKLTAEWREEQRRLGTLASADALLEKIKEERSRQYQKSLEDWEKAVEFWSTNGRGGKKPSKPKAIKILDSLNEEELASFANLPQEWLWEKLGHLSDIVGGVTKGRKLEGKTTIPLPYLRVANVQDGYLDLSVIKYIDVLPDDLSKYKLEYGDILYTEGGDRDKLGRGTIWRDEIKDCIHQNHIFRARVPEQDISSLFITYFSQSSAAKDYFFKHAKQTVNLASINLRILSNFPVPIPSTAEQIEIVEEIEAKFSIYDRLQADITTNLKKAEALRQSILKQAFEGKLVPQDPNDEPASVLLERIRAKKASKATSKKEQRRPGKTRKKSKETGEQLALGDI